jgi:hypothetical protein
MKAVLVELSRFSRRNTLSALGGFVGGLIIVVALGRRCWRPATHSRRTSAG